MMARYDSLSKKCEETIKRLLLAGAAVSSVARKCGVDQTTVARRKARLVKAGVQLPRCGCGRENAHKGMCAFRWGRFRADPTPKRGSFPRANPHTTYAHHIRRARDLELPDPSDPVALMRYIEKIIPTSYPEDIREDVRQDMLVDMLCGALKLMEAAIKLPVYVRRSLELSPKDSKTAPIDLYGTINGGDNEKMRLIDTLVDIANHNDGNEDEEYVTSTDSLLSLRRAGFK